MSCPKTPVVRIPINKIKEKYIKPEKGKIYQYCPSDNPITSSEIFFLWESDSEKLIQRIKDKINEESFTLGLSSDTDCLSKSLSNLDLSTQDQKCMGCEITSRFLGLEPLQEDKEIEIKAGDKKGQKIIVRTFRGNDQTYYISKIDNKITNELSSKLSKVYEDEYYVSDKIIYYYTKNKGLNYVLISLLINSTMKRKNFPFSNTYLWSYICREHTTVIDNIPNLGFGGFRKLSEIPEYTIINSPLIEKDVEVNYLNEEIVLSLIKQLTLNMKFLSRYSFTHSEASIKHLAFSNEKINIKYEGKVLKSTIKLHIIPSVYSGFTIYDDEKWIRYHSVDEDKTYSYELPVENFNVFISDKENFNKTKLNIPYDENYLKKRVITYKIGNRSSIFLHILRNHSSPIFHLSFDYICFLTSLMTEETFYGTFSKNENMMNIWRGFWDPKEYEDLMDDLNRLRHKRRTFDDIFGVVKKYGIRLDALIYGYHYFFLN